MKEIEDHTNRWKDTPCSWIGRIKTTTQHKAIYRLNVILKKYQWHFSQNSNKNFKNLYGNTKDLE